MILALTLVSARADAEGSSYFGDLSERDPGDALVRALAGFFQVRAGHDVVTAEAKLDEAATVEPGLPQYFRASPWPGCCPTELRPMRDPLSHSTRELTRPSPTWSSCSRRVTSSRSRCSAPPTRGSPVPT